MDTVLHTDITFNANVSSNEETLQILPLDMTYNSQMDVMQNSSYRHNKLSSKHQHDYHVHGSSLLGSPTSFLAGGLPLQLIVSQVTLYI